MQPSFKFDPTKGFLSLTQSDNPNQVFNLKTQPFQSTPQQLATTSQSINRVQQAPTTKVGTPGTILIRAPVATSTSKSLFTSLSSHPNVKIQESETSPRKVIAVRSTSCGNITSSILTQDNPASKQVSKGSAAKISPAGALMLSAPSTVKGSSNNITLPIQIQSGVKGISIISNTSQYLMKPAPRIQTKPILIRPKIDTTRVIEQQVRVPGQKFQLVTQMPPGLTTISQFKATESNYQLSQPPINKIFTAPVPALSLIQTNPHSTKQDSDDEVMEDEHTFEETLLAEQRLAVKRIIEGDKDEEAVTIIENHTTDESDMIEIEEEIQDTSEQCESQDYAESSSSVLLCDERITEVSPNDTETSKAIEVTPEKADEETVNLSALEVKKNLDHEFSMDCDKENVDLIIEEDSVSDDSSMTDIKLQKLQDYEESLSRSEIAKSVASEKTSSSGIQGKPKRIRKPKNPTIIASLGLPFKPSQPAQRKSKVEKKLEFELDFHDPINKIQWEDGIGGLNNCNKLFGFDEFGLIEVLNKRDAIAKLNQLDVKEASTGGNYKLRKITDPADRFTCSVCTKIGTIRDFYSPECCSESCLAITKRKSNELGGSSMGRESSSESGLATPIDERKLMFGGEAIPLQQLQQHLLEQQLPKSKRKHEKKRTPLASLLEQKFQWDTYLSEKSVPAPLELFKNPYPSSDNPFKVGMKLEAIDPENQKIFCVCTVEEKLGYRIKLHFDGYPNCYDFWENADSPNIFPSGFCHSTNRSLQTPPKWSSKKFDWSEYLDHTNSIGAQRSLFPHILANKFNTNDSFEIGMKLETMRDGKIYAASIIDKIGDRILISLDGHEELPCAWMDIHSPYLHPCNFHRTVDDPECFIPPSRPFDWNNYLASTSSKQAPVKTLFFRKRQPINFEPGSKLEIVDCVNRQLIRPATVLCRKDYKIQVIFDGFNISFAYWVEDDSDDIHPINWCEKTNHPIEHPAGFNKSSENGLCPSPGCRGIGNATYKDRYFHDNVEECPYDMLVNWKKLIDFKRGSHLEYKTVGKR